MLFTGKPNWLTRLANQIYTKFCEIQRFREIYMLIKQMFRLK